MTSLVLELNSCHKELDSTFYFPFSGRCFPSTVYLKMAFCKSTDPVKVVWPKSISYVHNENVLIPETFIETALPYIEVNQYLELKYLKKMIIEKYQIFDSNLESSRSFEFSVKHHRLNF